LLQEMVKRVLKEDAVGWNAIICAHEKGMEWEGAIGSLKEMVQR